jgi:hypothetical protein
MFCSRSNIFTKWIYVGYKFVWFILSYMTLENDIGDSFCVFSCIYFLCIIRLRTNTFYIQYLEQILSHSKSMAFSIYAFKFFSVFTVTEYTSILKAKCSHFNGCLMAREGIRTEVVSGYPLQVRRFLNFSKGL